MSHAPVSEPRLVADLNAIVSLKRTTSSSADDPAKPDEKSHDVFVDDVPVASTLVSDEEPVVTRRELWSYYLYCNGDNGVGPNGYSLTLFQSFATAAGYDPVRGPGSSCTDDGASGRCVVPWAGGTKAVTSAVLVANGVSFAIQALIFTTVGSAADYGGFGRWVLFSFTVICWAAQFASLSLTAPSRWGLAMALYMIGFVSYGATTVFIVAAFPRLARNTAHSRELRDRLAACDLSPEEYEREESLEKNWISNISTAHSNIGYVVTLCLNLSLLLHLASNPRVDNYVIVFTNGYWVLTGIWWFICQQKRPGPPLPKGAHYYSIGWKQIWVALKQYKHLPYTFVYLFAFFP